MKIDHLRRAANVVREPVRILMGDGLALAGLAAVTYGAWLIYQPVGFIVGGLLLIAAGVVLQPRGEG